MENCFVKQLNGSMENNNNPVFNQIVLHVSKQDSIGNAGNQLQMRFATNDTITVRVNGEGYFATSVSNLDDPSKRFTSKEITAANNTTSLYFKNDDYDIIIDGKYSLTLLKNSASSSTQTGIVTCDISDFEWLTDIEHLRFAYCDQTGDTSKLKKLTSLTECVFQGAREVTGSLNDLVGLTNLTELGLFTTSVTGSIEDFVSGQIANGRSTCDSMKVTGALAQFNFGGSKHVSEQSAQWLTWSSASKITVYVGSTLADATKIYAKGATSEEITAWEQAGKTVIVIS